jgi:hypothetical protein
MRRFSDFSLNRAKKNKKKSHLIRGEIIFPEIGNVWYKKIRVV